MATASARKTAAKTITPAQEAHQMSWRLLGMLKNVNLQFIDIGELLVDIRDRKRYIDLKFPTLEAYAEARLHLRRSALYKYIQVYDWVCEFHKEWLGDKPKGLIPDFNDVADLIWIERKLKEKGLEKQTRIELETMRKSALEGRLKDDDLGKWRKRGTRAGDGVQTFLSKTLALRRSGAGLKKIPADAIAHLDAVIKIVRNVIGSDKAK